MKALVLDELLWTLDGLGLGLDRLQKPLRVPSETRADKVPAAEFQAWLDHFAQVRGLEWEPVSARYDQIENFFRDLGPGIVRYPADTSDTFLLLGKSRGQRVRVLRRDGEWTQVRLEDLLDGYQHPHIEEARLEMAALLDGIALSDTQKRNALRHSLREKMGAWTMGLGWVLRLPPGAPLWEQVKAKGIPQELAWLGLGRTLFYLLWILSWYAIGQASLSGDQNNGYWMLWGLCVVSTVPVDWALVRLQGLLSTKFGILLKLRTLAGALALDRDFLRMRGSGQIMGQVIESAVVETMALTGGFAALMGLIEWAFTVWILGYGPYGLLRQFVFSAWVLILLAMTMRIYRSRRTWTDQRTGLAQDLVEKMIGHRTRIVQNSADLNQGEDQSLFFYLKTSRHLDMWQTRLMAFAGRVWLILGLLLFLPLLLEGGVDAGALAVVLGGVIFGFHALESLSKGLLASVAAWIGWREVKDLSDRARSDWNERLATAPQFMMRMAESEPGRVLLDAKDLTFRYRAQDKAVLQGANLQIRSGDRCLLKGASGGGKSTFASLLVGLRKAEAGLLLLKGVDRQSLGDHVWRREIVSVPQFQENHVLAGTLAFNLLMGCGKVPDAETLREAQEICEELGLGPLLERMPSGMLQVVGETGWRLSHGEKSRIYIARALLQKGRLLIFDESFGALDPESMEQALRCVMKRSETLLVIAHP